MKKAVVFVMVMILMLGVLPSGISVSGAAQVTFKDVPQGTWYYEAIQFVANDPREIIVGSNGIFNPKDSVTVEQFITIAVKTTGWKSTPLAGQYWAAPYIDKALNLKIVLPGEFTNYKRNITRAEMARIVIRALPLVTGEKVSDYTMDAIKAKMLDYNAIRADLRYYVCQAYEKGILVGGTDNKYHPDDNTSRAVAAVVANKMINTSARDKVTAITSEEQFWSDEEFERYMRDNAKKYPGLVKIEDKKIYWRSADSPTPTLLDETYNPGINDILYTYTKHIVYFAVKNGQLCNFSYVPELNSLLIYYRIIDFHQLGDIALYVYTKPQTKTTKNIGNIMYRFHLGTLYDEDYIDQQGWYKGIDNKKINWLQPKYEVILKQAVRDIYGQSQGNAFYDFARERYLFPIYTRFMEDAAVTGPIPGVGVNAAYEFFSGESEGADIYTTRPEVRE